jgi:hypothetical protein
MSTPTLAPSDSLLAHHPLGVSTGFMSESRGDWPEQVRQAWDVSPFAVELSALSEGELDGLAGYLDGNPRLPFRYLSVLPDAGFCFDIAHAWSLDATMTLGDELLDAFRTRLRQVHVSSMGPSLHHVSLTDADEELFMPLLHRCLDVPWILEAPPRQD